MHCEESASKQEESVANPGWEDGKALLRIAMPAKNCKIGSIYYYVHKERKRSYETRNSLQNLSGGERAAEAVVQYPG